MHFIKLLRPINLLIIAATMFGLAAYFDAYFLRYEGESLILSHTFILLVVSTVLIAGAGNIINDYFDVVADRINRPERLIIDKYIKRRWAIVSHWVINVIAFAIAVYLSIYFQSFWYVFVHLVSINVLWFYSSYFKRTKVLGNVLIALLTALVPFLVGIFYQHQLSGNHPFIYPFEPLGDTHYLILYMAMTLGFFAFFLNLAREIIKDIEDKEGDKELHAHTLPLTVSTKKTKIISTVILLIPAFFSCALYFILADIRIKFIDVVPLLISAFFVILSILWLWKSSQKANYHTTHLLIKVAMVSGLLTPLYWLIIA